MRVLHLRTLSGTGGGPEKTIFNSSYRLKEYGCNTDIVYIVDPDSKAIPSLEDLSSRLGVNLIWIKEKSGFSIDTIRKLKGIFLDSSYDIVHSHDYKSNLFAVLLARGAGCRVVITLHGYNPTTLRERIYYCLDRFSFKKSDAIITPAYYLKRYIEKKYRADPDKVSVIYNGIDISDYEFMPSIRKGSDSLTSKIIYAGRLSREKRVFLLIEAVRILISDGFNVFLTIAGDGRERPALEELVKKEGISSSVLFTGYISQGELRSLLYEQDILVLPSEREGLPNVLLEAMAVGVAAVASRVGGVDELIRDGIDGLLFDPEEGPAAIAWRIKRLIEQPSYREGLIRSARQRIESNFTFDRHIESTVRLYNRVLLNR